MEASAPLSEKVLKEKRKKLKETLERVLKLYVRHQGTGAGGLSGPRCEMGRGESTEAAPFAVVVFLELC